MFGGKTSTFLCLDLFSLISFHSCVFFGFLENMAEVNQSTVKIVHIHQLKIDVVKFDGTNNFGVWRCEVMDALAVSSLKDSVLYEKKSEEISKKDWDKMN